MQKSIPLFALILFMLLCKSGYPQGKTEILWDNYGVPHIYASTDRGMYYAAGWAQMHNHGNLILKLYAQASGRAAEFFGPEFLESDKKMRLFNLPDSAAAMARRLTGMDKLILESFVDGVNGYVKANPDKIDQGIKKFLPVTVADVMAHGTRVLCLEFLAPEDIATVARMHLPGSNAYAIAPSKSASKNAMLVANPHLPWGDFFLFFEEHLNGPGFNAYGASLIGVPTLNIAFNDNLGWTHTVNTIDASDRYEISIADGGYQLDGKVLPFTTKKAAIKVLQENGILKEEVFTFNYTVYGPVVKQNKEKGYAIRIAGLENMAFNSQYHKMGKASSLKEFETAVKMLQNPMFNVIYADKGGNILYLFGGDVPKRTEGDWAFWNNTVDGRQSKYIWHSYLPYADLPRLLNPTTGFVQNANDPPWSSTYPGQLKPENYPPYMSPVNMEFRPQRSVNLIRNDASITYDELVAYKMNTGMEVADRFLDDLLAAVEKFPDSIALQAAQVLKRWDKMTDRNSRGAVLFAQWFDKLNENMFAIPWDVAKPVTTPDGLADPKKAVELLSAAATDIAGLYGSIDVPWGEVYRFKIGDYDFPANGAPGDYGVFRTMYYQHNPANKKNYAYFGDSYVAITEFGKTVKAQVLLSYGNATQPGSKHIGDQLKLLSGKKLRPALLTREAIGKEMEELEVLRGSF